MIRLRGSALRSACFGGPMISLKKYLDSQPAGRFAEAEPEERDLLCVAMDAYGSALLEMGNCSLDACPGLGDDLKRNLGELRTGLSPGMSCESACGDRQRRAGTIARLGPGHREALSAEGLRSERTVAGDGPHR